MEHSKNVAYQKLVVWQRADELAIAVYRVTKSFPNDELYGVTGQLRRASLSVPTNIVEGTGRQGKKSLRQFINIALGSLAEVEYLLGFCHRLGYLTPSVFQELDDKRHQVGRLLWGLYSALSR